MSLNKYLSKKRKQIKSELCEVEVYLEFLINERNKFLKKLNSKNGEIKEYKEKRRKLFQKLGMGTEKIVKRASGDYRIQKYVYL